MKVGGPGAPTSQPSSQRPVKAGGAFNLPGAAGLSSGARTGATSAAAPLATLDALIALQANDGPLERRRRAVGRAGRILDELDGLKLALIDGRIPKGRLETLGRAVREARDQTDDPNLEGLLNEIETRAEVELAKLQQAKAAA